MYFPFSQFRSFDKEMKLGEGGETYFLPDYLWGSIYLDATCYWCHLVFL